MRQASACVHVLAAASLWAATSAAQATDVHVETFGALPDDGQCDRVAIQAAIEAASAGLPRIVRFDAGVYNLHEPATVNGEPVLDELILIENRNSLTLLGAVDPNGAPATVLERNAPEQGVNLRRSHQINVVNSTNITLRNLVSNNNPAFSSAGECVLVDEPNDVIEVDVFAGLPHYDGMPSYSANAWNLQTRDLLPIEPLSIGVDITRFTNWQHVPGGDGRRYRIQGEGMAAKLNVGDGVSWHFTVKSLGHQFRGRDTLGLTLDNVTFHNAPLVVINLFRCTDVTLRRVIMRPLGDQLAVGSRDGIFVNVPFGDYLMEDCYIKGVRWDPLNSKSKLFYVTEKINDRTIKCEVLLNFITFQMDNTAVTLHHDGGPTVATVESDEWDTFNSNNAHGETIRGVEVTFKDDLPANFGVGSVFQPNFPHQQVIRNCVFEGNFGRPILYQAGGLEVTGSLFRNNAYESIALGPVSDREGGFVHDAVIRGNTFVDTTWIENAGNTPTTGTIKTYQNNREFENETYNNAILIEENIFDGISYDPAFSAIDLYNAQNVTVRCNTYLNTPNTVQFNLNSTRAITIENDGQSCLIDQVSADFNDMNLGSMRQNDGQPAGTGVGFAEDYWSAGTVWVRVVAGDLTAPVTTGYGVATSGLAQRIQGQYADGDRRQARELLPVTDDGGEEIWISFLAQNVEASDVAGIDLTPSNSFEVDPPGLQRKILLEGTTLKVVSSGAGGGEIDVSNQYALGETALVLAKLITNDLNEPEQIEVWVNPNVTNGPSGLPMPDFAQLFDLGWDLDSLTWLGLQSWDTGPDGIGGYVDNIRICNGSDGFEYVVQPVLPGDCDDDNSLGWTDYLNLESCMAGPDVTLSGNCTCSDLDFDSDSDLMDLGWMQRQYTGDV